MTTFTELARHALGSDPFGRAVGAVAVVALVVSILLLVEREILRARAGADDDRSLPRTDVVIAPLVVVFTMFVLARFVALVI